MPVLESTYKSHPLYRNAFVNTVVPALFRAVPTTYRRERVSTLDDDFIDLDWSATGNKRLVLVLHGLEGSSESLYIKGIVTAFNQSDWDGVVMNFRSCSGEPNKLVTSYHAGKTDDVAFILNHILQTQQYEQIALVGFSLGGNVALNFVGQQGNALVNKISHVVVFSVPCDLVDADVAMKSWSNRLYINWFMQSLNQKLIQKAKAFPDVIDWQEGQKLPKNFKAFDDLYTAPVHGFGDAMNYWRTCSSVQVLQDIAVPTLIVNALDDSFLGGNCYPYDLVRQHGKVHLETPKHGGHVGFVAQNQGLVYWAEQRTLEFVHVTD